MILLMNLPSLRWPITSISLLMNTSARKLFGKNIKMVGFMTNLRRMNTKLATRAGTFCFLH